MVTVVGKDLRAVKQCTCKSCASILEYNESEVQRVDGKDYSGGSDGHKYIRCPNCGQKVVLESW